MNRNPQVTSDATGFTIFEFDILRPLIAQLKERLSNVGPVTLSEENIEKIPERAQGVYQLFINGELKYIGKSDADAGLGLRLHRHCRKMKHRVGLNPQTVSFRAAEVPVFSVMDLESELIAEYKRDSGGEIILWNGSGFGSNDPGRRRDTSNPGRFDQEYPIDIDIPIVIDGLLLSGGTVSAADLVRWLSKRLPYTLRVDRGERPANELKQAHISIVEPTITVRQVLQSIVRALPGWQATVFKSHVILYQETIHYGFGEVVIP